MADGATDETPEPRKSGKLVLLISLLLALAGGGGGFAAAKMGLVGGVGKDKAAVEKKGGALDVAFVPVEPIIVSLGAASASRHLTFRAQLEVPKAEAAMVSELLPRVVDVMNGYLRAVDVREFEKPTALIRLRSQMLRRVQMVAGEGRVRDLLVMEFVLN